MFYLFLIHLKKTVIIFFKYYFTATQHFELGMSQFLPDFTNNYNLAAQLGCYLIFFLLFYLIISFKILKIFQYFIYLLIGFFFIISESCYSNLTNFYISAQFFVNNNIGLISLCFLTKVDSGFVYQHSVNSFNCLSAKETFVVVFFMFLILNWAYFCAFNKNIIYVLFNLLRIFILTFGLLIYINAEFLALIYIMVYIGAVMVLFLFTVMILSFRHTNNLFGYSKFSQNSNKYLMLGFCFLFYLF